MYSEHQLIACDILILCPLRVENPFSLNSVKIDFQHVRDIKLEHHMLSVVYPNLENVNSEKIITCVMFLELMF